MLLLGDALPWVDEIRYLGIFIVSTRYFKCSLDHAKRAFYRASNAIFGKIGRIASEEVILELIVKKCLPALLYGLEACVLNRTEEKSLNFPCTRFLMKLFRTGNNDVINEIRGFFNFAEPSVLLQKRKDNFLRKLSMCENLLCKVCTTLART